MSLSINSAKLFKSGKFMMTAAATIAVVASATATTLTSVNADDSAAPAKVTTSQKVDPSENHTYKGHVFDAPIRVETHDLWTANSESVIADNMSKQGIKSVDQLGDYKVVWGDTLSTIAAHFHVSTDELVQRFDIADANYIAAGITMKNQANINELESQVVHDAQWNGEYYAKVAASQASDAAQSTGASDVANAQANATAATPDANTDKGNDTNIGNASDVMNGVDNGKDTPAAQPATDAPAEDQKPVSDAPNSAAPSSNASAAPVETQTPASETPKTDAPTTPVETQSPASEAPAANDKSEPQAPTNTTVPANPVDGSTFIAIDPASTSSFGGSYGPLTYHTSFSGISVSDLTHGAQQGLWLDTYGNAHDPYYPVRIFYTKGDVDNLVPRYNAEHTPVEGTELERPDQLVGGASGVMNSIG